MQFIEGNAEEDDVSDDEQESELCQPNIKGFDSLHVDQVSFLYYASIYVI